MGAACALLLALFGLLYFVLLTVYPEAQGVYSPSRGRFLVRGGKQVARGVGAPVIQPNGH